MNILLANLGNRNITYNNKLYNRDFGETFRGWTKNLLENYEDEKKKIGLQIIDKIISKHKLDKIILFATNQEPSFRSDTIYEAEIFKKLIKERYDIDVDIIEINCDPTNEDDLILSFKGIFKFIQKNYPEAFLIFCDAGGTPLMKSSCKVILEFFFDTSQFRIEYVSESEEKTKEVRREEYNKILLTRQAITLFTNGEYKAALMLLYPSQIEMHLIKDARLTNDLGLKYLTHLYFRFNGNFKNAKKVLDGKISSKFKQFRNKIPNGANRIVQELDEVHQVRIEDLLYKTKFFFELKNYSAAVLSFAQFYELLIDQLIKPLIKSKEINRDYFSTYYEDFLNQFNERPFKFDPEKMLSQALYLASLDKFKNLIEPLVTYLHPSPNSIRSETKFVAINQKRNKVAHEGLLIDQEMLDKELFYFESLLNEYTVLLGLEGNLFLELNKICEKELRK